MVITRVQIMLAFKTRELDEERVARIEAIKRKRDQDKEVPWWKSGSFVILPSSRARMAWGAIYCPAMFISYITMTYQAAFHFRDPAYNAELLLDLI